MRNRTWQLVFILLVCLMVSFAVACGDGEDAQITGADFSLSLKEEYARNEVIDLSSLSVTVKYDDGTTRVLEKTTGVTVTGGDTSAAGKGLPLTVSFGAYSRTYTYNVRDTEMTLVFGAGSVSGDRTLRVVTPENYTDVQNYQPTPDDADKVFAGWFYDEACTRRAQFFFDTKVNTTADVTLYAGYDRDYSGMFTWEEHDGTVTLLSYLPDAIVHSELVIPATIELYPVTAIGEDFCTESEEFLYLFDRLTFSPGSFVEEIGSNAFAGSYLTSAVLPDSLLRINVAAFMGSDLHTLRIPAMVERIEAEAFESCGNLREVTFAEGSHLQYIGEKAFALSNGIAAVDLPDALSIISDYVFSGCGGLQRVRIGKNVTNIGLHAFRGCAFLREVSVDSDNAAYSAVNSDLYNKNGKTLIRYCFGKMESSFTVPEGVTDIFEGAFDAFNINSTLHTIVLPQSLTSIWNYAFRDCDASFVLPAGVRNISSNAFSESLTTAFAIDENNPYFTVKDGVLYTHDMRELVAVPACITAETFVLDPAVETIRSGAMSFNKTLKYFIIPENSALRYMDSKSFVPGYCQALSGIYVEKPTAFSIAPDAMQCDHSLLRTDFVLYIGSASVDSYKELWGNYFMTGSDMLTGAVRINDYIVSAQTLPNWLLTRIAELVRAKDGLTSPEDLREKLSVYCRSDYDHTSFSGIFSLLDGAYRAGASLDPILSYLSVFETTAIRLLTENYDNFDGAVFGTKSSYRNVYARYLRLSDEDRATLSDIADKMEALVQKTDNYYTVQRENIDAILQMMQGDMNRFNAEDARRLYETYEQYGQAGLLGLRWSDTLIVYCLRCSVLINDFLNIDIAPENLFDISGIMNGYFDGMNMVLGINNYLKFYIQSEPAREQLFRYDAYKIHRAAYDALIDGINRALIDFDFAHFDRDAAEKALEDSDYLDFDDMSFEASDKYMLIVLRLNIMDFISESVTEGNYARMAAALRSILVDADSFDACGVTAEELAALEVNRAALRQIFERRQADLISTVESITPENFATVSERLAQLFTAALENENDKTMLRLYPFTIKTPGGDIRTTLGALCATTVKSRLVKQIILDYSAVTEENYADFSSRLAQAGGISDCEQLEDEAVSSYIESRYLTDEEVDAYNRLLEQYKELRGW